MRRRGIGTSPRWRPTQLGWFYLLLWLAVTATAVVLYLSANYY